MKVCNSILFPAFKLICTFLLIGLISDSMVFGQTGTIQPGATQTTADRGFPIVGMGSTAGILLDTGEHRSVIRAARDLQADIERVTSVRPLLTSTGTGETEYTASQNHTDSQSHTDSRRIIIGTIGHSPIIDGLIRKGMIDTTGVSGRWESACIEVVEQPIPGVTQALVIAGSDNRGTIFGIYEVSYRIGVSPWYYWADVPVKTSEELYFPKERIHLPSPAVQYRGIFINDEAPALAGWAEKYHGGFTHTFYEKVFELILRLRGNFLWPAMWGRAFYDDDPLNPEKAEEYGIVTGTSHHEPMARAHDEWRRYGSGPWNYQTNKTTLQDFWKNGLRRAAPYEHLTTIGMRGDGDEPMTQGTAIGLLENIVADQRRIIGEINGKSPETVPQVWALYKEVQDYYDQGMRVPDDVTLLLCDDNWGNLRKLPRPGDRPHPGGYGIYYHFDYVGGPRNYKWLNTNPIPKIWEQMNLAYRYGANKIWIVNVGDIKPMEFPTEFFLDLARDPEKWHAGNLDQYTLEWAERQFGPDHAQEIARLIAQYTKFNGRRKPEMIDSLSYSLHYYREWERISGEYNKLASEAENLYARITESYKDAYFQLVLFPILACANLNELHYTVARNHFYALQGRNGTNQLAETAEELFRRDSLLTYEYNHVLAGGKWSHMMDQTHIGYTYWQQPEKNIMPEVQRINIPEEGKIGVYAEGNRFTGTGERILPESSPYMQAPPFIELFNTGRSPEDYRISVSDDWLQLPEQQGTLSAQHNELLGKQKEPVGQQGMLQGEGDEIRLPVSIDWSRVPPGRHTGTISISSRNGTEKIHVPVHQFSLPLATGKNTFVENDGYISMEAIHYNEAIERDGISWELLPDHGRTHSAMTALPVNAPSLDLDTLNAHLIYRFHTFKGGEIKVHWYVSPTLDFRGGDPLRFGVSADGDTPETILVNEDHSEAAWERAVGENISRLTSIHQIDGPGEHVLKFWFIDPAVVLQKIVIDTGGLQPSYLGPPESYRTGTD